MLEVVLPLDVRRLPGYSCLVDLGLGLGVRVGWLSDCCCAAQCHEGPKKYVPDTFSGHTVSNPFALLSAPKSQPKVTSSRIVVTPALLGYDVHVGHLLEVFGADVAGREDVPGIGSEGAVVEVLIDLASDACSYAVERCHNYHGRSVGGRVA